MSNKKIYTWNGLDKGLVILDKARIPQGATRFMKNVRIRPDGSLIKRGGSSKLNNAAIERYENTSVNPNNTLFIKYDGTNVYVVDSGSGKIVKYSGGSWSLERQGYNTWEFVHNVGGGTVAMINTEYDLALSNALSKGLAFDKDISFIRDVDGANESVGIYDTYHVFITDFANDTYATSSGSLVFDGSALLRVAGYYDSGASKYYIAVLTSAGNLYIVSYDGSTWASITNFALTSSTFSSVNDCGISNGYYWAVGLDGSGNRLVWVYDTSTSTSSTFDVSSDVSGFTSCYAHDSEIAFNEDENIFIYDNSGTKTSTITAETNKEQIYTLDFRADGDTIIQQTTKLAVEQTPSSALIIADYFEDTTAARLARCSKGWALLREGQRPFVWSDYGFFPLSIEEVPEVITYDNTGSDQVKIRIEFAIYNSDGEQVLRSVGSWVDVGSDVDIGPASTGITVRAPETLPRFCNIPTGYTANYYITAIVYDSTTGEWEYATKTDLLTYGTVIYPGVKTTLNGLGHTGSYVSTNGILPPTDYALHTSIAEMHLGRLVMAKDNKIYWSDTDNSVFDYTYWWLEVGDTSPIIALASWRGNLYIFKDNGEIWILRGEFPTFAPDSSGIRESLDMVLERVTTSAGRVFPLSVKSNERGIFFANRDNLYIFNGYVVSPITVGMSETLNNQDDDEVFGTFYNDEYGEYYAVSIANKMSEPSLPVEGDYRIYIPEYNNHKIKIFDVRDNSLKAVVDLESYGYYGIKAIVSDLTGVYVMVPDSSGSKNDILKFDYNGNHKWTASVGVANVDSNALVMDSSGLWYADSGNIKKINTSTGSIIETLTLPTANGITVESWWIFESRFAITGYDNTWRDAELGIISSLGIDVYRIIYYDGYFYVYDSTAGKISKILKRDGSIIWTKTPPVSFNYGFHGIWNGYLYYIGNSSSQIVLIDTDGNLYQAISKPSELSYIYLSGIDYNGDIWVWGTDGTDYYVYKYDVSTATWTQISTADSSVGTQRGYYFISPQTFKEIGIWQ